jgi:hypothetical protein
VRYDPDHVGRLIHKLGLRVPEPPRPQYHPIYATPRSEPSQAMV